MAEESILVDWSRTPNFWRKWNIDFKVDEMSGDNNFQLVFVSYAPDTIDECLDGDVLNEDTESGTVRRINCGLRWDNDGIITIADDVVWDIGNEIIPLKAIFLVNKQTQFVLGYSINIKSFDVTNRLIVDGGTRLWAFHNGGAV